MSWGTLGETLTLEGASGRDWMLRFERKLAPRDNAAAVNQASSVWLVRDDASSRLYAAKRQALASLTEVDALVDEAAAWRAACLAGAGKEGDSGMVVELVDVFVSRTAPLSVTFLAEFCARGLLPRRNLSEPVLLTLAADLAAAAAAIPSPHAHMSYDAVLVDAAGRVRLAGFGAHRSAILRDNPGLTPNDDAFDIGLLLYELVFGAPPADDLAVPDGSPYSQNLVGLIEMAFTHPHPNELREAALRAGAEPLAPVVDVEKPEDAAPNAPTHVARAVERNVDRLIEGVDIAPAFTALLSDLKTDPGIVAGTVFKTLFKKPMSTDPLCSVRALTMVHNLILDGPDDMLEGVRKNDKFMDWIESSWTREVVEGKGAKGEKVNPSTHCFAAGELAFYSAFLRRKARFHQLAAGGFSGRWDRLDVQGPDGRNVLETRRRKVISGMADLVEMASELGCLFAAASDEEAPAKHAGLGAMVSDCCLAYNAALELAHEVQSAQSAEKLVPGIQRLYNAARVLVFAVESVPSAGGADWVEQFASETAPDIVKDVSLKERMAQDADGPDDLPKEGWGDAANVGAEAAKAEKKRKKKKKKAARADAAGNEGNGASAADGAIVVHGADEAAAQVTTMFGDLLRIGQDNQAVPTAPEAPRPLPDMSNAKALASAFGVAEDAVQTQYQEPEGENGGYEDENGDDGGYENFQARQNQQQTVRSRGTSTAAWAARSGYSSSALVVSDAATKKSHPAFCQCAICQQEEVQAAAQQQAAGHQEEDSYAGNNGTSGAQPSSKSPEESNPEAAPPQAYGADAYRGQYNGDADSLDDEDGGAPGGSYQQQQGQADGNDYYENDYDSYESVEYNVDQKNEAQPQPQNNPFGDSAPSYENRQSYAPPPAAEDIHENYEYNERPMAPSQTPVFKVEKKKQLVIRKLRQGDKISETDESIVSKGEYNRETVAIKKLTKKGMQNDLAIANFVNEVKVMSALSHPNMLGCTAASVDKPNYILVTDFCKRGSLFEVMYKNRIKLTWALIRKISLQIAQGMAHMHERGFLHRDLKTLNILSDAGYNIKIGDFGLSQVSSAGEGSGLVGTYQYMAPEVLSGDPHSDKSDVFSFGHIVCEMISGTPPFQGMDMAEVRDKLNEGVRPPIPRQCQRAFITLLQRCWGAAPSTRPSFAEIVTLINSTK